MGKNKGYISFVYTYDIKHRLPCFVLRYSVNRKRIWLPKGVSVSLRLVSSINDNVSSSKAIFYVGTTMSVTLRSVVSSLSRIS